MVYVSNRFPASMKTTSVFKPLGGGSVALTQSRSEKALEGSPWRKTSWPFFRISILSIASIPVVMLGWRSLGRLPPLRVWCSRGSSGSRSISASGHFRLVRSRLPGGRIEGLQPRTLSSPKLQPGQELLKIICIFWGFLGGLRGGLECFLLLVAWGLRRMLGGSPGPGLLRRLQG